MTSEYASMRILVYLV